MKVLVDPGFEQLEFVKRLDNPFFVDKTRFLSRVFECMTQDNSYVCVTRPRRFGKSTAASMIASFFGPKDSSELFDGLAISQHPQYAEFLNTHHVIYMNLICKDKAVSVPEFLGKVENRLVRRLCKAFPQVEYLEDFDASEFLQEIMECTDSRFVFVIDEWDHILDQDKVSDADKKFYLQYFTGLLKDQSYVSLAYMTGILPISMYSAGSDLNMFRDYTFINDSTFDTDFGFTEEEVDNLYTRYQQRHGDNARISREDLDYWYNGYTTKTGKRLYNPKSIVEALDNNELGNYWGGSGPYNEVFDFVRYNVDAVREDIEKLVTGIPVSAVIDAQWATQSRLTTREEILSALVVYGLLTLDTSEGLPFLRIPNEEIRSKYVRNIFKNPGFGSIHELVVRTGELVLALQGGDADRVAQLVGRVHSEFSPVKVFNNELELAHVLHLGLLGADNYGYKLFREMETGRGFADVVLVPQQAGSTSPVIVIELKVGADPRVALEQIRSRGYGEQFAHDSRFRGRILGVGISYDPKDPAKTHQCEIEVLREAL